MEAAQIEGKRVTAVETEDTYIILTFEDGSRLYADDPEYYPNPATKIAAK